MSALAYLTSVVLVNCGFVYLPQYAILWSLIVGLCFVLRDWCQTQYGHGSLIFMLVACLLSYWLASPVVAMASAMAFALSELVDYGVYTWTKRPIQDRILLSSSIAVPLDSLVFLVGIGAFSLTLFFTQIAAKMIAAVTVYALLRRTPSPV